MWVCTQTAQDVGLPLAQAFFLFGRGFDFDGFAWHGIEQAFDVGGKVGIFQSLQGGFKQGAQEQAFVQKEAEKSQWGRRFERR